MTRRWQVVPAGAFGTLAARWNAANDAGCRSPLLHADFVGPCIAHFGDPALRVAFDERADGSLGRAGVFARSGAFVVDSFQPSQAPIGLWLQDDGAAGLPAEAEMASLATALGATVGIVGLSQLDPELVARDAAPDPSRVVADYIDTARITIRGTFDDYWAARGKNLRANMKKQKNRLDADDVAVTVECLTVPGDVAGAIADYGRLESAGWKASEGTAVAADNAQGRFYVDVFERFAARGAARIYRSFHGDRLAAMDLCIDHAGTMVILKTAFDESMRATSPAFLMRHAYLPELFATRRFERVEFYGRVMDWHTKWTDEVRTLYHATSYRWPLVARLDALRRARRRSPASSAVTSTATPVESSSA